MNLFSRLITAAALLAASTCTIAAPITYDFSYTFNDGTKMTGSAKGTASANLVSGLSDIHVFRNGVAFSESITGLFGNCYGYNGAAEMGCAVMSFDGMGNNVLFIDTNDGGSQTTTNFYYDQTGRAMPMQNAAVETRYLDVVVRVEDYAVYVSGKWSLLARSDVPEPASIALFCVGLAGFAAARRRKQ